MVAILKKLTPALEMFVKKYFLLFIAIGFIIVNTTFSFAGDQAKKINIAAFGDSLSAGFGLGPGESFPEQLQQALIEQGYANITIINAGNSGDTSADGLSRLDWSIGDDIDAVILEFGANDGLRGLSVVEARQNIDAMLQRFQEREISVLLTGMEAPPNMGDDYRDEFRKIYPDLAAKYNVLLYPFFLDGVAAQPKLNQADGIHPNKIGVEKIVKKIMPDLIKLIEQVKEKQE